MKFRERTEIVEFNEKNVETITQTQRIRVRLFLKAFYYKDTKGNMLN